jgi:hypothetical protein
MKALFFTKELMDVVDGTTLKPPPLETCLITWIKKNSQTMHLLCQVVEEKILKYIMSCSDMFPTSFTNSNVNLN